MFIGTMSRLAVAVVVVTILGRCAPPINPRLAAYDPGGCRYANARVDAPEEELFVILAFSGGGTRAAAFSYGLLEGLQSVSYQPATGPPRTLLDDVDVISSVSGGSFTAAHYALFGTEGFKRFEETFLYRNIQGELIARALLPWNWARLLRSDGSHRPPAMNASLTPSACSAWRSPMARPIMFELTSGLECSPILCAGGELRLTARTERLQSLLGE